VGKRGDTGKDRQKRTRDRRGGKLSEGGGEKGGHHKMASELSPSKQIDNVKADMGPNKRKEVGRPKATSLKRKRKPLIRHSQQTFPEKK